MNARSTLFVFAAIQILIYLVAFSVYLANPLAFHFRAWEFFDIFVFNGVYRRHQHVIETGDSSRNFLLQRYVVANNVTTNEFGNRIACYNSTLDANPHLLVLGDSQLFASGTDDSATFPMDLCRLYHANVYNGSRRNGLTLLRVESLRFDSLIFTTTERIPLASAYCAAFDHFIAEYDHKIPATDIRLPNASPTRLIRMLVRADEFFDGYMKSRLDVLFNVLLNGPIAPPRHLILLEHRFQPVAPVVEQDINCAKTLAAFFEPQGIAVGFLYFPAHQTMYGQDAAVAVDNDTASFIDRMSDGLAKAGLRTLNTKACLDRAKSRSLVYQMHDTHLNAYGYESLAECLGRSDLRDLIAPHQVGVTP